MVNQQDLLKISQISKKFKLNNQTELTAVNNISFTIKENEIFGLAGESGSGKSTLARIIAGMYPPTSGDIFFQDKNLTAGELSAKQYAKNIHLIFQNVGAALNPKMTVQEIIAEPLLIHHLVSTKTELNAKIQGLLNQTELNTSLLKFYPDELSGGQKQRVNIARCLALNPKLIIADEPIASLDISIQAQIINLFMELQKEHHFSMLFIAHDLLLLRFISNRIGIMYKGHLIELAQTEELFNNPQHNYTKSLLSAISTTDPLLERQKKVQPFDESDFNFPGIWNKINDTHYVLK